MKTTKKNCKNKHEANIKNYVMIKKNTKREHERNLYKNILKCAKKFCEEKKTLL